MSRLYAVPISAVAVTAAQDLWEILAPSTTSIRLHAIYVSQSSDTDSEQLRVTIRRVSGAPTSGSGGTAPTPTPIIAGDVASSVTAEINNTTRLTGGTAVTIHEDSWNVLGGWVYLPTPEMRPTFVASTRIVVGLETVPADSLTINGVLYFEEL